LSVDETPDSKATIRPWLRPSILLSAGALIVAATALGIVLASGSTPAVRTLMPPTTTTRATVTESSLAAPSLLTTTMPIVTSTTAVQYLGNSVANQQLDDLVAGGHEIATAKYNYPDELARGVCSAQGCAGALWRDGCAKLIAAVTALIGTSQIPAFSANPLWSAGLQSLEGAMVKCRDDVFNVSITSNQAALEATWDAVLSSGPAMALATVNDSTDPTVYQFFSSL